MTTMSPPSSYSRYIALFVDVMGQQTVLSKTPDPLEPDCLGKSDTQKLFNESVERIQSINYNMKGFFDLYSTEHSPCFEIKTQFFSDCMLFYFPVEITEKLDLKEKQLKNIFSLFFASSMSLISYLALETPLRGGIDLGLGALTSHAGLYGPVVNEVVSLEKRACYPRIAVGNTLLRYIRREESHFPILCKNLLNMCIDRDDSLMIDYAGPVIGGGLLEADTKIGSYSPEELIKKAVIFVRSERDKYKVRANKTQKEKSEEQQCLSKDNRLYEKYSQLYEYFRGK